MGDRPSIAAQADAVELAAENDRGHLEVLRRKTGREARPTEMLAIIEQRIPVLDAAARTLRWVHRHEAELRERFGLGRNEEAA